MVELCPEDRKQRVFAITSGQEESDGGSVSVLEEALHKEEEKSFPQIQSNLTNRTFHTMAHDNDAEPVKAMREPRFRNARKYL